jgi:hypothetical protein
MFGWSHDEFRQVRFGTSEQAKLDRLRIFYENTKLFVIDEINAVSAAQLGLMDEMMCKIFDPDRQQKLPDGTPKPFGGKTMVFMGDSAQLRPVDGVAIYDSGSTGKSDDSFGRARNRLYCSQVKARAARGQQLYVKFLSSSCIWLKRGFRNRGLLEEIFDRVRNGEQTRDDLEKIMYQRGRFPQVLTDCGIHYSNESCTLFNYQDLWRSCQQQQPPTRVYVSRAGYHTTGDNDQVVRTLSTIQSNQYQFAPDVLCVAEGCEVRLVKNLNVAAGLVNSASGTVSRVIYNNADVPALMRGEHPPAYCIVVRFPGFRGFLKSPDSNEREFPLPDRQLVPLYRVKFFPDRVPGWIRKKQSPSTWYREQFPIDLSRHITAHRAQGQTWKNRLLSVNLNLESPDNRTPPDVASIIYVACTRINELKNLFVQPIFPTVWDHIGQSEMDKLRRQAEDRLQKDAEAFALKIGSYREFQQEQAFVPDYTNNAKEWQDIVGANEPPPSAASTAPAQSMDIDPSNDDGWLSAVASERHIGIDQGVRNWAMVAVDRTIDSKPIVVGAELYDLRQEGLNVNKFDVADLVLILQTKTVLTSWMQLPGHPALDPPTPHVDRVIVHIEQISKKNKYNKQFTIDLGRSLQRLANVERCVVKLSHPHVHRRTGPMFKMGNRIVAACGLSVPSDESTTTTQRKRRTEEPMAGPSAPPAKRARPSRTAEQVNDESDVEPDDVDSRLDANSNDYRTRKRMSSAIFQYIIKADAEQQEELGMDVNDHLQRVWQQRIAGKQITKFDDLGDAFLHAVDELLCGTSSYRPLIPSMPSLHINRTVVLAVFPRNIYWIVLRCAWNLFTVENLGVSPSYLQPQHTFRLPDTRNFVKNQLDPSLQAALVDMSPSELYTGVEQIKIVIKQLTANQQHGLPNNRAAGALTNCVVNVAKKICDEAATGDSQLCQRNTKKEGCIYTRTLPSGQKFQVVRSTGKHTNAMLACLQWAKKNIPQFVESRRLHMTRVEKTSFFNALEELAAPDVENRQMEMVRISDHVASHLQSNTFPVAETRTVLADLILIGLNINGQYISAISTSYRRTGTKMDIISKLDLELQLFGK